MGGSVKAHEFKDKVTRKECVELIRLIGHVRVRSTYLLAYSTVNPGKAQMLTQLLAQRTAELAEIIEQAKEFTNE